MKMLAATGNRHKLLEISRILSPLGIEIVSPADVGIELEVEETGSTFAENARIKALAFFKAAGMPALADDSGLCVEALGGRPGVYSARYFGGAPQREKNAALLRELESVKDGERAAYFACVVCCSLDNNTIIEAEGRCTGTIARIPAGDGGFGYDPIFEVNGKTLAELSDGDKDRLSHRGAALRELANKLSKLVLGKEKL